LSYSYKLVKMSVCVSVCVCLDVNQVPGPWLTRVAQIVTTAQNCNLACTDLLRALNGHQNLGHRRQLLTYFMGQNQPPKKVGENRHFQASWDAYYYYWDAC